MEPIQLTEEQKTKLIEMANVLFPEYAYNKETLYGGICFHHLDKYKGMLFGFKGDGSDSDTYDTASMFIHWFEFCMTYLAEKIFAEPIERDSTEKIRTFLNNCNQFWFANVNKLISDSIHPIEYLYKYYKKEK